MATANRQQFTSRTGLVSVPSSVFGGSDRGASATPSTPSVLADVRPSQSTSARVKPTPSKFEPKKAIEGVSTVAQQRRRQHVQLVADLAQARLQRQRKHQGILTLRLDSRREQADRMSTRYNHLIRENRELKREIEEIERSVMGRVHNNLTKTVGTKIASQTMLRQFQREVAAAGVRRDRARARRDAAQRESDDCLAEMDEELLREATALKELLIYQQTGRFEDQRYKMRVQEKLENIPDVHERDFDRVLVELDASRTALSTFWSEREEEVLSFARDQTLGAMSPRLHATSAENINLRSVIEQAEREHENRTAKVAELEQIARVARLERSESGLNPVAQSNLPSRAGKPLTATAIMSMASLADDLGFG
eukprot:m.246757 g.246757  ORF g.246757 m.246757 type:complete len:368 (+) comp26435_c0_seq3:387-1490(+)